MAPLVGQLSTPPTEEPCQPRVGVLTSSAGPQKCPLIKHRIPEQVFHIMPSGHITPDGCCVGLNCPHFLQFVTCLHGCNALNSFPLWGAACSEFIQVHFDYTHPVSSHINNTAILTQTSDAQSGQAGESVLGKVKY